MVLQATKRGFRSRFGIAVRPRRHSCLPALALLLLPALANLPAGGHAVFAQSAPSNVTTSDSVEDLLTKARAALDRKDYRAAEALAQQAKAKAGSDSRAFWKDSPDQILTEIANKTGRKPTQPRTTDPRVLIKQGQQALEAGNLELAQDLARQAEAVRHKVSWGLFEDTPSSLLRDVQRAKAKRDEAQSDVLLKQARSLYERTKQLRDPQQRINALSQAEQLAYRAARLHGPYSIWHLGDRPSSLIEEIETDRAKLSRLGVRPTPARVADQRPQTKPSESTPNPVRTVGHQQQPPMPDPVPSIPDVPSVPDVSLTKNDLPPMPPSMPDVPSLPSIPESIPSNSPEKARAVALVKEARSMMINGQPDAIIQARGKLLEAQRMKVTFGPGEESPDQLLTQITVTGKQMINAAIAEADHQMTVDQTNGREKAKASLHLANQIANGLGLDSQPMRTRLAALEAHTPSAPAVAQVPMDAPPPIPNLPSRPDVSGDITEEMPFDPPPPIPSKDVPGIAQVDDAAAPPPIGNQPPRNHGHQLLENARTELRAGNTEMARRMAEQAFAGPYGVQEDAQVLMREIMTEDTIQKQNAAIRSLTNGTNAYQARDYKQALAIFQQIDATTLPPSQASQLRELSLAARNAIEESQMKPATPSPTQSATLPASPGLSDVQPVAHAQPGTESGADSLAQQMQAMQEVKFQKLRREGLQAQSNATKMFGKGETDAALQMLEDYLGQVDKAEMEPARVAMLKRPIEYRMQNLQLLKRQKDFYTNEERDLREAKDAVTQRAQRVRVKEEQVAKLMKDYNNLLDEGNYDEAKLMALKARELDPDNTLVNAALRIASIRVNQEKWDKIQERSAAHRIESINDAFDPGPVVTDRNPIKFDPEMMNRSRDRSKDANGYGGQMRTLTPVERAIESKMSTPVTVEFRNVQLGQALEDLRIQTGVNIVPDLRGMADVGVTLNQPVSLVVDVVPLKSVLNLLLKQVKLTHTIEDNVLKVTSERSARGRLVTKVYSVADLVVPIENYAAPTQQNFIKVMEQIGHQARNPILAGGAAPFQGGGGMTPGAAVGNSSMSTGPGGGRLTNDQVITPDGPMSASAITTNAQNTMEAALIKLITNTIDPDTWAGLGGAGTIDYYPIGMALVVNQTPDVIEQVSDLLQALRRLQDLEVAVEVRLISLSETFFERIGMDFAVNIETNNTSFEPQLTTGDVGIFAPAPFINAPNVKGKTLGLTPAGTFTSDLNVPIRSTSFEYAIPPFGGYPNAPGFNGGLSLGLAFLNDIQVFMFLEAAQGDRRVNVMQAPKITLFNGQSSTLSVNTNQFFVTNVQVLSAGGQIVFVPSNMPIPAGGIGGQGLLLSLQAVVSADRRFVRLNLNPQLSSLASATVPLFPITTFVTPVFEGGSQGQPIPFTQFIQQPALDSVTVQTTVQVPDGGTVLLGGLKTMSEGRNEFGPPIISKIPYINRLVRNVGYGREAQSLMIMVTPRIIINSEEELRQTGLDPDQFSP